MASILQFPNKLFAESPRTPQRTSPSAEEAAFNRPRFGLNLGSRYDDRLWEAISTPRLSIALPAQVDIAVARIDLEISHLTTRTRLLRLLTGSGRPSAVPA